MKNHFHRGAIPALAASLVIAGLPVSSIAGAAPTGHAKAKKSHSHKKHRASKTSVTTVSSELAATFSALRRPAASTIPENLRKLTTEGFARDRYATNPALTRLVPAPDGDAAHPWYVVPGDDSLCLFAGGTLACQTLADAQAGRLMVRMYDPVGKSPFPPPGTPVHMTAIGMVPDGYTDLSATTKSGQTVAGALSNNVYKITVTDPSSLHFDGPAADAAPITMDFL